MIYECYTKQVYSNPTRFSPSYQVDWYFDWLDKLDLKQCCFVSEKTARKKLAGLRERYLEEKRHKDFYRRSMCIGEDTPEGLHKPNQEEFEVEILKIFDRHYVVKPITWTITLED